MNLFKTAAEMPASERPFAEPVEPRGFPMIMESPKPEVTRVMLSEADRRVAMGPATYPMRDQAVKNLTPVKRGRHY